MGARSHRVPTCITKFFIQIAQFAPNLGFSVIGNNFKIISANLDFVLILIVGKIGKIVFLGRFI